VTKVKVVTHYLAREATYTAEQSIATYICFHKKNYKKI